MTAEIGIQTLASRTGVSAHALRYYEKTGLMIPVPRDRAGRRVYDEDHVRWVSFLLRLREGGMGIAQVRTYATLTQSGSDAARDQRLALLEAHRDEFRNRISRLAAHLEVLERKVASGCAPDHIPTQGEQA